MASQRIAIVGTESTGKTVLITALAQRMSSVTGWPRLVAQNSLTRRYTAQIMDELETGAWPKSTDAGMRKNLGWLWHDKNREAHEFRTFDCAGQDFRAIYEAESDAELNEQQQTLRDEIESSDLILLLLNISRAFDIHNQPGTNRERHDLSFAPAAALRRLRAQGIVTYVLFTQADRFAERVNAIWDGDFAKALENILPEVHMALTGTGTPCACVNAIETEFRDGAWHPKTGCKPGALDNVIEALDSFIIQNKDAVLRRRLPPALPAANPETVPPADNGVGDENTGGELQGNGTKVFPQYKGGPSPGEWAAGAAPGAPPKAGGYDFFKTFFGKYAVFSGRASRKEYWLTYLIITLLWSLGGVIFGGISEAAGNVFLIAAVIVCVCPLWSLSVRRLHDINCRGWWLLLNLVPYVGSFALLIMACIPGAKGGNKYGPSPYSG
ncbi:MAG: DUF805 domain-containing protein [Opitutaceae bacterium]|jgi:uncharacterized membrane protein YhaH (DUF805 family)|nr:DUF805 domain-containing protein [Opitutaceae bacterium]